MSRVRADDLSLVSFDSDLDWTDHWNKIHCRLVAEERGADYRNNYMADYCEEIIKISSKAYYTDEAIMPDTAFDRIERSLKILRPDSSHFKKVGYEID